MSNTTYKTWTLNENSKVLFQNKNWSIEKYNDKEIAITNGFNVSYAYLSVCKEWGNNYNKTLLYYDTLTGIPQYIQDKALALAKKHIELL